MDYLNKYALHLFHIHGVLSEFFEFDAVRNEKSDGNGLSEIFAGIAAELPEKCSLISIHTAEPEVKGGVGHAAAFLPELQSGFAQPTPPDVFGGGKARVLPKQPVGVPWGKQRCPREIGHRNFPAQICFNIVLHPLDGHRLVLHLFTSDPAYFIDSGRKPLDFFCRL